MANKNRIQEALGEARENLILGKYNEAMMLMAQITMDVIEHITDEALIVSGGYEEDLKTLRANGIIADDTAHNFETLIISGVQAHNGVDIPKEHAEQALQVLTNELDELDVIFKNEESNPVMTENLEEKSKFNANAKEGTVFEYDEDEEPYAGDFSKDMTVEGAAPAFMQKDSDDFRTKERIRAQMLENEVGKKTRRNKSKLIAIIIPIVFIILLFFVVRAAIGLFSGGNNASRQVETTSTTIETSEVETTEPVETEPPTPPEAGYYRVTGDLVKIRDAATTENSKVIATVNKDATVMVKQFYNNDWALIAYEGKDAYISRKYIKKADDLNARMSED